MADPTGTPRDSSESSDSSDSSDTSDTGDTVQVVDVADHEQYEIRVGDEVAGFAHYLRIDGRYVFDHTVIEPTFEGRGLGSRLAGAALADVRAQGELVVPLCPFIAAWIHRHPDHGDLVDHELLQRLRASG